MEQHFAGETVQERLRGRIAWVNEAAKGTVCGDVMLELLRCDEQGNEYVMLAHTKDYMRNVIGMLHGGCTALIADQAMGCVANSLLENVTRLPTSQLQMNYHRPLTAGERIAVKVRVVSVSRSLIHLSCELYAENHRIRPLSAVRPSFSGERLKRR